MSNDTGGALGGVRNREQALAEIFVEPRRHPGWRTSTSSTCSTGWWPIACVEVLGCRLRQGSCSLRPYGELRGGGLVQPSHAPPRAVRGPKPTRARASTATTLGQPHRRPTQHGARPLAPLCGRWPSPRGSPPWHAPPCDCANERSAALNLFHAAARRLPAATYVGPRRSPTSRRLGSCSTPGAESAGPRGAAPLSAQQPGHHRAGQGHRGQREGLQRWRPRSARCGPTPATTTSGSPTSPSARHPRRHRARGRRRQVAG